MKKFWHFAKTSGIYFAGTVLQKIISFFLLPIYTKYINPKDMGTYDVQLAYVTFLCSVLFLNIWSGIMRYTFEYKDEERKKPITTGMSIFMCSSVLYTVLFIAGAFVLKVPYLEWIYLYGILSNVQTLLGYLARCFGKNALYATAGLGTSVVTMAFNVLLIVVFRMDYSAMFISSCIGFLFNVIVLGIGIRFDKLISIKAFDFDLFKRLIIFSIPLCLNSIAFWFLTAYSRVAISNILGEEQNGMYAIAGKFSSFITLFTTCFNLAWQEITYVTEANVNDDRKGFYTQAINYYMRFLGMGVLLLIPVVYVIYPFFINESYSAAKVYVPLYLFATIASVISEFLGEIFTATKMNKYLFWTTVTSGTLNVISVHVLIPILGVQGASLSLLIGFCVNTVMRLIILRKEISISLDLKFLGFFILLAVVVSMVYIHGAIWSNIISFVIVGVICLFVFKDILLQILQSIQLKKNKKA